MKTYDFTKERWQDIIIPIDNTPCIHSNDNGHTEWQDWFHVKPFATDSLFNHFTGSNSMTYRRADNVIILEER
jgi:hypothetical protein